MDHERKPRPRPREPSLLRQRLPLENETSWLLLLGVLDLALTVVLLNNGAVREANPLARWALALGGIRGLVLFKCGLLAFVTMAAQLIALRRPSVARWVLLVGVAGQLVVVTYSAILLGRLLR